MRKRKLLFIYTKKYKERKKFMNIKDKLKNGGKRIIAGALATVTAIAALPLQSLAVAIRPMALRPDRLFREECRPVYHLKG